MQGKGTLKTYWLIGKDSQVNDVLDGNTSASPVENVPMCPMASIVMEEMARRSSSPDIKQHGGLTMRALYSPVSFEDITRNRTPMPFSSAGNSRQSSRETSPKKSPLCHDSPSLGSMNTQNSHANHQTNTNSYTKVNNLNENNLNGNVKNGFVSEKVTSKPPLETKKDTNLKLESNLKKYGNKDKMDQSSTCCIV